MLSAALKAGTLTDVSVQLDAALEDLTRRAQQAGLVRADLVADDLPRMVAMFFSVLCDDGSGVRWLAALRAR